MARRTFSFTKRLSKMSGVSGTEKEMYERIGELIDGAVNNRGPTGHGFEDANIRIRSDVRLPPPKNITLQTGVKTAVLEWPAVDSSILLGYRIRIIDLNTKRNDVDERIFTNRYVFKGRPGGVYRAIVQSVSRAGFASPGSIGFDFILQDTVMLLEGSKNGTKTVGTFIGETILTPKDHLVFAWGSFVFDGFSDPGVNRLPVIKLLRGPILETAIEIERIELFGKSETAASFKDDVFLPGGISRPGSAVREGAYESSHAVIFNAIEVDDSFADQQTRFWVVIDDTDYEGDIVSASIVLWVASGGRDEIRPEGPPLPEFQKSLELGRESGEFESLINEDGIGGMKNFGDAKWSIAMWIRPEPAIGTGFDPYQKRVYFWDIRSRQQGSTSDYIQRRDSKRFVIGPLFSEQTGFFDHSHPTPEGLVVEVYPDTSRAQNASTLSDGSSAVAERFVYDPLDEDLNSDITKIWHNGLSEWYFFVVTFNGDENPLKGVNIRQRISLYRNGFKLPPTRYDIDSDFNGGSESSLNLGVLNSFIHSSGNADTKDSTAGSAGWLGDQYVHQFGIWTGVVLSSLEIRELYNSGRGAAVDWRNNSGSYTSSEFLAHYYKMGDITLPSSGGGGFFGTVATDIGTPGAKGGAVADNFVDLRSTLGSVHDEDISDEYPGKDL